MKIQLTEGQEFYGVLAELVCEGTSKKKRVRTLGNQEIPSGMYIECSKMVREYNPLGTIFKINVGVTSHPGNDIHLYSLKKHELLTEEEWGQKYG